MTPRRVHGFLALYVVFLVVLLTVPVGRPNRDVYWLTTWTATLRRALIDGAFNVALFAPLGWALHRTARDAGLGFGALVVTGVASAGLSVGLETVQYLLPYRFSSLWDVIANVTGGVAGGAIDRLAKS